MNRLLAIFSLVALISLGSCEDPETVLPDAPIWERTYGTSGNDFGNAIEAIPGDQGFLIAGATRAFKSDNYDVFLLKTDNDGDEQGRIIFGEDDLNESACHILRKSTGEYIVMVQESDLEGIWKTVKFYEIDTDLNVISEIRTELPTPYPFEAELMGTSFFETASGGFILFYEYNNRPAFMSFDQNFALISSNTFSDYWVPNSARFATTSPDSLFALAVSENEYGNTLLLKVDEFGQQRLFTYCPNTDPYDQRYVSAFSRLPGGEYLALYKAEYETDMAAILLNPDFSLNSSQSLSAATGYNLIAAVDSTHFVLGGCDATNYVYFYGDYFQTGNCFAASLSLPLSIGLASTRGGSDEDRILDYAVSSSGKVAFVGGTKSYGEGLMDVYLFFE